MQARGLASASLMDIFPDVETTKRLRSLWPDELLNLERSIAEGGIPYCFFPRNLPAILEAMPKYHYPPGLLRWLSKVARRTNENAGRPKEVRCQRLASHRESGNTHLPCMAAETSALVRVLGRVVGRVRGKGIWVGWPRTNAPPELLLRNG